MRLSILQVPMYSTPSIIKYPVVMGYAYRPTPICCKNVWIAIHPHHPIPILTVFISLQLLYEFNKVCDEDDMASVMEKNWYKVCEVLIPNCQEPPTLLDEKKALQMVEKNIYHKKPAIMPITLSPVSLLKALAVYTFL